MPAISSALGCLLLALGGVCLLFDGGVMGAAFAGIAGTAALALGALLSADRRATR